MPNYIYNVLNAPLNQNVYANTEVEYVDLRYAPWVNNSMANAFKNCTDLVSVKGIADEVTNYDNTFCDCYGLTIVDRLSNVCNSQLTNTFRNCRSLVNVPTLPDSDNIRGTMIQTFYGCTRLVNAPIIPNWVNVLSGTFTECSSLTNVPTIPNSVLSMESTFAYCTKLRNVPTLPNSVETLSRCFAGCTNLVNMPIIPDSVTNLQSTFAGCINLINTTTLPNGIENLAETFKSCTKLTDAPTIPNSVTNLSETFRNCQNLTNDIIIQSNQVSSAVNCFSDTSLSKFVFIPYYNLYSNATQSSLTKTTFETEGYDSAGTKDGVILRNLTPKFTINTIPAEAQVSFDINGFVVNDNVVVIPFNTTVNWTVQCPTYRTTTGTQVIDQQDVTLNVELTRDEYTISVIPIPADSTVKLESPGYTTVEGIGTQSITLFEGDTLIYTVINQGYITQVNTISVDSNQNINITLTPDYMFSADEDNEATLLQYMDNLENDVVVPDIVYGEPSAILTLNPTPSDATLNFTSDNVIYQTENNSIMTLEGSEVSYTVSKEGYLTAQDTFILSSNRSINVTIYPIYDAGYIDEVVDEPIDAGAIDEAVTSETDGETINSRGY